MKVERITISNFRCFGPEPVDVSLQPYVTALVGNNGSGKTAVMAALGRLFGVTVAQRTIVRTDFHVPADAVGPATEAKLSVDCTLVHRDVAGQVSAIVPEVFHQMSMAGPGEPLRIRIRLEATWTDDSTPEGSVEEEVRWIRSSEDDYVWDTCPKLGAVDRNLIQLIYVPAVRNAFGQVTNLLKGRLWRAALWSQDFLAMASSASLAVQERFDREEPATFIADRLARRWAELHQGDTDAMPVLRLIENRFEELVRRAEFMFVSDRFGQPRPLSDLSDGQRSLFHMALTAATLEMERDAMASTPSRHLFDQERLRRTYLTLLAIEEPENSLSPFFLSRIMTQARDIGSMPEAQVLVSSHSASILGRVEPEEVRHTSLNSRTRRSAVRTLSLPTGASEASAFVRLAVKSFPELYFARFVVLVEGESEAIVIPRVAEAMGVHLDRSFVPIVPLGGRFVRHFWRLLEGLRIPYATLLDLDLGRRHGGVTNIEGIVAELRRVDRDLSDNRYVVDGSISLDEADQIDDAELLASGQDHPWIKALRQENVFFSTPIDLDFSMLSCIGDRYMVIPPRRRGPRQGPRAVVAGKRATLKTGGDTQLYPRSHDDLFRWYPYLFLDRGKPESHLSALARIDTAELADSAPAELRRLVSRIRRALDR